MTGTSREGEERQVRIGGLAVRVADDKPTFWDRVVSGRWEPGLVAWLARRLGPGATFLDLGAWTGPLTLLAAAAGARVIAVEADPAALDGLRANLAANPELADRVTILHRAVASSDGEVRLGARRKRGDSMSSPLLARSDDGSWSIPGITPAALAAMCPARGPLVVKLDIEGAEYDVLPAFGPLLARPDVELIASFHPGILRETGRDDIEAATRVALRPLEGWASFAIGPDGPVPRDVEPTLLAGAGSGGTPDTWLFAQPLGR